MQGAKLGAVRQSELQFSPPASQISAPEAQHFAHMALSFLEARFPLWGCLNGKPNGTQSSWRVLAI